MKLCSVDHCGRRHNAKGFCKMHYKQMSRLGFIIVRHPHCTVDGCNSRLLSRLHCRRHHTQMCNHGEIIKAKSSKDLFRFEVNEVECLIHLYDTFGFLKATTIIDSVYFDKIKNYTWNLNARGYVQTGGGNNIILLHRFILDAPKGVLVDHKDLDRLNNRKDNLRLCNQSQNMYNKPVLDRNKCGIKGLYYNGFSWTASINCDGKKLHIGSFSSIEDAIDAYNKKATEVAGEFARLVTEF